MKEPSDPVHNYAQSVKIFISWSLPRSQAAALALKDWIELALQSAQTFVSAQDIDKGTLWASTIFSELESTNIGIICVTPENLNRPWLSFEAGAIAKRVGQSRVMPFLFGMSKREVPSDHPLFLFHATSFEKHDMTEMLISIANSIDPPLVSRNRLEELAPLVWPKLEERLKAIEVDMSVQPTHPADQPNEREMLEEVVQLSRSQQRQISELQQTVQKALPNRQSSQVFSDSIRAELSKLSRINVPVRFNSVSAVEEWVNSGKVDESISLEMLGLMREVLEELKSIEEDVQYVQFAADEDGRNPTVTVGRKNIILR